MKIDGTNVTQTGTVAISPGVSHVVFTPDGKHALALKSPDNKVAVLDIDGDKVTYNKLDIPTYAFPYNIVVTPDSKLAITADNGNGGSSDGSMDAVTVIDLEDAHPHAIAPCHGGRCARGPGDQPERQPRRGAERRWLQHEAGLVLSPDGQRHDPAHQTARP